MLSYQTICNYSRFNIVGTSNSGKTTFGRELAALLSLTFLEIDAIYWKPDWRAPDDNEFLNKLTRTLEPGSWVLDGNYNRWTPVKWANVNCVIWLDYSFPITFYRAIRRSISRIRSTDELWPGTGNVETFSQTFFSMDSILLWTIREYRHNRSRYRRLMVDSRYCHIEFIRLASPNEASEFLKELGACLAKNRQR